MRSHTLLPFATLLQVRWRDQVHIGIRLFVRWCCHLPDGLESRKGERSRLISVFSANLLLRLTSNAAAIYATAATADDLSQL